ncbi:MAG: molybdopterin-dependent oxidoreductase [Chloroflexi bacterium]|nr:molybdopterin-dependent oxidoreductase [Chloroflexota bacterium]
MPQSPGKGIRGMLAAMMDGSVKAAVVMADGLSPVVAGLGDIAATIAKTEFRVISAVFESELTEAADVVLPATTYAEETGTTTNLERRVQLLRPCRDRRNEEKAGWETVATVARRLGAKGFEFADASAVFEEMRSVVPAYAGLSHARLEGGGVQWPCPEERHPGTPILPASDVNGAKLAFTPLAPRSPARIHEPELPFVLVPGRVLHQPDRKVEVIRKGRMNHVYRHEYVEVHPEDAGQLGIREGDRVSVAGPELDGTIEGTARLTSPQRGLVGVTRLFGSVACEMQDSGNPDPVPSVPGLTLCRVSLSKVPAAAGTRTTAG